ncbi:hypothetical protein [Klenkia brasiliensis]|uniref:Uncharacterized protein n=1 Tax=Klenkia brasiliensis TaxID=333142 RepID=A0A1G7TMU2_9ACTN|nr:hypothetical protein [Klenkia brasiliensis]SDG35999.1 hypothetical protein SAMN05660324_2523 [Klenkia brasiliensis]
MTKEPRPLPFFDETDFGANFLVEVRNYGLTDEDLGGWREAELAHLFYQAREHGLDPKRLGTWMRELGDSDAVRERWLHEEHSATGRDDDGEDHQDEDEADEQYEDEPQDVDEAQAEDFETGWAVVGELAQEWSHVWYEGSEHAWLRYAWSALNQAGMTAVGDPVDRAEAVARLLALTTLYRVFHAHAHETEHVDEWQDMGDQLCGREPLVSAFVWGQLSERRGLAAYTDDDDELPDGFAKALVWHYAEEVARALTDQLGENLLFASLWASSSPGVRFPLNDRRYHESVDEDPWEKMTAYTWVSDGMSL